MHKRKNTVCLYQQNNVKYILKMETATISKKRAIKSKILEAAKEVVTNYVKGINETGETASEVEFEMYGKLIVVEFSAYMSIERAQFTGTYDCPPDDDEVYVDIDWMEISVTNDYEPLENLNEFINE